ncbi:hypothetical protein Tco_0115244 [Tanacetum coccineum]
MVAATEPKTIQKVVQISGALTDEAVRNRLIKKVGKKGNVGEPSKDENGRDDNKRTRLGMLLLLPQTLIAVIKEYLVKDSKRRPFWSLNEDYYSEDQYAVSIKEDTTNDINIELSKEFLEELQVNAYHGWIDEDMINHIAMVLKMIDSIYIPGVDSHRLRMKIFPLSLADEAKKWWINEGEGKITIWEELIEKFFCKFYPESYDGEEEMLDEGDNWGIDPLEFISRVNSSFDKHMKMDGRTKKVLFHAWINRN